MTRGHAITALALAIVLPFIARLPGMVFFGPDWFLSYIPSLAAVLFISALNLIPAAVLLALGAARAGLAFWLGALFMGAAQLALHGSLDLASDSTAAVALAVFPLSAGFAAVLGWALGLVIDRLRT